MDWLSELMFKLALEHPHIAKKKRANGRPKSLKKFANDRSVLKFAFKLKGIMSGAQGREVSFRKVARNIAVLDLLIQKKLALEEAWESSELEDLTTKFAKRIATLRKAHPDIETDSKKPT